MKINKIAMVVLALASLGTASCAIDEEFAGQNNPAILKMRATHYKSRAGKSHHGALTDGGKTDTESLLEGIEDGNLAKYAALVVPKMKASAAAFVDYLLEDNGDFLHNAPAAVPFAPADQTRDRFKKALGKFIDTQVDALTESAIPASASMKDLIESQNVAAKVVSDAVAEWTKSLLAGDNQRFLVGDIDRRCHGQVIAAQNNLPEPENSNRDEFANALGLAISNHAYHA